MILVEYLRLSSLFKRGGDLLHKGSISNEWADLMLREAFFEQFNYGTFGFDSSISSKRNEVYEQHSFFTIVSPQNSFNYFLSITRSFMSKKSSKAYKKSRVEEYGKANLFCISVAC